MDKAKRLKQLASKLKALRKLYGYTQADLADAAGLSDGAIKMIETGRRWPRPETLELLASAFDGNAEDLLSFQSDADDHHRKSNGPIYRKIKPQDLSAQDLLWINQRLLDAPPDKRSFVLGILLDDHTLFPESALPVVAAVVAALEDMDTKVHLKVK